MTHPDRHGHLSSDELVDIAEGARAESSAPHLQACEACRSELANLREMMFAAARVDVPEPSPLFWDHLSARIREGVAGEGTRRVVWWHPSTWPFDIAQGRLQFSIPAVSGVVAVVLFAVILTSRVMAPGPGPAGFVAAPPAPPPPDAIVAAADSTEDPSLSLVADLVAQMDWESASQMDVALHADLADEAMSELSDAERREMRLLLQHEGLQR
jgi:hypothetical protein